jgi:lysophospholipase L1-like esterase
MQWTSYAAVGDSFTEGLEDERSSDRHRGWADRLAEHLADLAIEQRTGQRAEFRYANLAIRGRKLPAIVHEQIPRAVSMQPDLISIAGGVNDALRPTFDLAVTADLLESGVATARAGGADVLLVSFGQPARRSKALGLIAERLRLYREEILRIADEYECLLLDLWHETIFDDPRMWADDRLHLNEQGHLRVAGAALDALDLPSFDWRRPLPPPGPSSRLAAAREHAEWTFAHLGPWLVRRAMRRSSGDGVAPKRPDLAPITEPAMAES